MNRRNFIKSLLASSATYKLGGVGALGTLSQSSFAANFPALANRVVVNIMLPGGPDMRHLLPPTYNPDTTSFGYQHWQARQTSHNLDNSPQSWLDRWDNDYFHNTAGSTDFGILKKAGWLQSMWDANNVAIVNNVFGATTRDHSHCQLVMDQGNITSGPGDVGRSGWGGRLASAAEGNIASLSPTPRRFCFGPDPSDPEGHLDDVLVSAADTRNIALYSPPEGEENSARGQAARSLQAYYAAKRQELPADSIYRKFIDHENKARIFGDAIDARLSAAPIPASLAALYDSSAPDKLIKTGFGQQIRNLYDVLLTSDILQLRVASMEYGGWDSHKNQRNSVDPQWEDILGSDRALDRLFQEVPAEILDQVVFVIGGEFGRQLKSNGNHGTDHGKGTSILVIGNGVNGGVYGDMFPAAELSRLADKSPDITGETHYDHLFGEICNWASANSSDLVFPQRSSASLESGVDLSTLFT